MSQRSGPCSQRVLICDFRLCRFYFCFYCSHLFQTCKPFLRFYAWSWCSEAPQCISFCEIQKAGNILVLKNCSLSFAILLFWWAYTLSLNLIFFLFEAKNEQMILHFAERDEITTGTINNFDNVDAVPALQLCFVYRDYGFYCNTILFQTARTIEASNMFTDYIT